MWGLSSQMDSPRTAAQTLAAAGLWEQGAGWPGQPGGLPTQQQHLAGTLPAQQQQASISEAPGPAGHHTAAAKVYVQGLPQSLQHPVAVAGLFTPFGDVLDVKLYAAEVRLSGGSAVVRMRSTTQAATAIAALNGAVPEGGWQQLTVRSAETAEQRSSRITAINGRQTGPGSPMQQLAGPNAPLPPSGPGAALRRVHSARGTGSQGALHSSYPSMGDDMQAHQQPQRRSVDWAGMGAGSSMHSSRRSSMDAMRTNARCSSDSGSGSIDELPALAASEELPSADLQRMLLEAVLALVGQVEGGQLSLGAMRMALESALTAAKHGPGSGSSNNNSADEQQQQAVLLQSQGSMHSGRMLASGGGFRA